MFDLQLTPTTRDLLAEIKEWSIKEVRPHARAAENLKHPPAVDEVVAKCPVRHCPLDFRYIGPAVRGREDDKEYVKSLNGGGSLLGVLAMEEMNVGDGWGWQALPGNNLGERAVRLLGDDYQVYRWADGILRGDYKITSICMTEEHCGLDLSQIRPTAVQEGDEWVLNGTKRFISHGAYADYLVVFAQTRPGSGLAGIRAFIVEPTDEGFFVDKYSEDKLGVRYYPNSTLRFDNIRLPKDRGLANNNFGEFMAILNGTRPFCAAIGLGTAKGMLEYAVDWVNQHDKPFSPRRRQAFYEQVEIMTAALDRVRRMLMRSAWKHDQDEADPMLAHKAKAYALPILEDVSFRSMQLMGPAAWSTEHLMEKWYRDSKFNDIVEGTGNMHRIFVAREEFGN